MKSLLWLTETILLESGMKCGADPSLDIRTVKRRTEAEGESFLTITLPAFGAALDRAFATGILIPSSVSQFHWHRKGLPEFLRGFLVQIFSTDGRLLLEPSHEAILCVRQICFTQKKILRPCVDAREQAALKAYKECENEVRPNLPDGPLSRTYGLVARVVWSNLLADCPEGNPYEEYKPAHGPGATQEKIHGNAKFRFKRWHTRLEEQFPFTEFGVGSLRNLGEELCPLDGVGFIEPEDEEPVRVVFVPKTQKTPRVIAIEPVCMQYAQQAICRWLVPTIERGAFTGGRVNFSDQTINGRIALSSSSDGRFATIDLSEASDRVSSVLVHEMLSVVPVFRDQVFACRSTRAQLPDGDIVTLKKFASMGSALCFPMEAMVFFCAIVAGRLHRAKTPVTGRSVAKAAEDLYIYGDDILVPSDEAPSVCDDLTAFGLKINRGKSFWTGKFRESCGVDAYDGTNVTPTYLRHEQPAGRQDVQALASWTATANLFYERGFWQTAREMRRVVEKILGPMPVMSKASQGLHWVSYNDAATWKRWSKTLMRFENRLWVLKPSKRHDPLGDDGALLKCFSTIGAKALVALEHLTHSVARGKQALVCRWVPC